MLFPVFPGLTPRVPPDMHLVRPPARLEKKSREGLFFQFLSKFAAYLCSTKRKQHLIIHT